MFEFGFEVCKTRFGSREHRCQFDQLLHKSVLPAISHSQLMMLTDMFPLQGVGLHVSQTLRPSTNEISVLEETNISDNTLAISSY